MSTKVFTTINGAKQGMFIQRHDETAPVLLYLHGGMPEYFLDVTHPSGLEKHFTVVWWEQRGSGISYDPRASRRSVSVDQRRLRRSPVTAIMREDVLRRTTSLADAA